MKKKQLIKSTSGIRGVIGNGLDPVTITTYGAAFGTFLKKGTVVLGSDSRPSGEMVRRAVTSGLMAVGIDVIDIGIVPTPTVEIAVKGLKAVGGICVTASHNPAPWNALKFFNNTGEFITPAQYKQLNRIFESGKFAYCPVEKLGTLSYQDRWIGEHIKKTLAVKAVNKPAIKRRRFKVVVDAINGAGSEALPAMLDRLGVETVLINCKGDGNFVHEPEPTPKNLAQLGRAVKRHKADIGLACDPDADRLALVNEKGEPISEELTLTIAVGEVLKSMRGPTVINLSTSRVTADIARAHGSKVFLSRVGEANVVEMMRKKRAVVGGEGNGGVILPSFHAGRDSLIASALVLSALARAGKPLSEVVATFPQYSGIKGKAPLPDDFDARLARFEKEAAKLLGQTRIDRRDGLRFDFAEGWVQLRKSNTEPIYRLIVETTARDLTSRLYRQVTGFFKG
ncbi:MAG: phosphoglucosamine mutase [candidate division Zixibacteria bacterium]|nr:phosphoglucosamine mutase [candidate division Zixibacteria bacterium]